ncbi:MAG: hypothetical protein JW883_15615 [Deltaproteobacteria bacterium]|nr:hypothetical protein [Deltaproteobacteria bacterium]
MNPEQLRQYMEKNKESTYLVVDVRQPEVVCTRAYPRGQTGSLEGASGRYLGPAC